MIIPKELKLYNARNLSEIPQFKNLSEELKSGIDIVSHVLPFRTNNYVVEELIDWSNIPDDPIFQLTFPQKDMLMPLFFELMENTLNNNPSPENIRNTADHIRHCLNPHPAGQLTANVPVFNEKLIKGVQHKYKETVLIFPSAGQTCHAYCTFCFRWAQFVGIDDLKFATDESQIFLDYIREHKEVTDVLVTGGDPMVMSAAKLEKYIRPLLGPDFSHIRNIRIGTKSIAYWPYKYITDKDSDSIIRLFDDIISSGKHLAIMAHFNHWMELSTPAAEKAISRIRNTGAIIRAQAPLIRHINDKPEVWSRMWQDEVSLGIVPYYMFIERNTGAENYFALPLANALNIFIDSYKRVSGLSRGVRGPVMSANPGKIRIEGTAEIKGEKVFVLNLLQARNPEWVRKPFFAKYDETSTWFDQLDPAFGEEKFFFQDELDQMLDSKSDFTII